MKRSKAKDAIAWSIVYGGGTLAQVGFFAAAVSAGLLSPHLARNLASNPSIRRGLGEDKKRAWDKYKETGNLFYSIQYAITGETSNYSNDEEPLLYDISTMTVQEIREILDELDDVEVVSRMIEQERNEKSRTTAIEALLKRLNQL
jgi:hypothetical protein